ncbi:MAG: polysulfide reductase NrfD, partial [Nitrospirae bacterium]|nr:polysulfide reductase NrfD [Nitrospirota bacterium]
GLGFIEGQEILEISPHISWSMLVAVYVFYVVAGSGMCIVTSLGHVFGIKRYELISRRGVFFASIAIISGLLAILLHLGHVERAMTYVYLTPNLKSGILWMGMFYSVYLFFVIIEYWLLAREDMAKIANASTGYKQIIYSLLVLGMKSESGKAVHFDHKLAKIAGGLALVTGLAAVSTLGAVFGHLEARSLWYGAFYPAYFILSATFSGLAFFLFITILTYDIKGDEMSDKLNGLMNELARLLALMLSVGFLFTAWRIFESVRDPKMTDSIMVLLNGPFSFSFYVFEILVGTIIPIGVLLSSRLTHKKIFVSSLFTLIGLFVMRYNFLTAGQVSPGLSDNLPSYFPAFFEIVITMAITALFGFMYTLGVRLLPIKEEGH